MILHVIQVWSVVQLVVIVLLILFFNMTRLFINRAVKKSKEKKKKITKLLKKITENPKILTPQIIDFFNRSILELLLCMEKAQRKNANNPNWDRTKKLLSDPVLKKQSVKLSKSKDWYKKYLTLLCYELGFHIEDEKTLLQFIKDDNLIISTNAAIELFKKPNPFAINEIVTTLSKGRHVLQTTFASMLINIPSENTYLIRPIFTARLNEEKDPYVRIFCYRILEHLKPSDTIDSFVENDLLSENIDLKILALKYVAHIAQNKSAPFLLKYLDDANNEVRAVTVKLLGDTADESVIPYLNDKLKDPEWWVRINSANSLLKFGAKGIAALKEQSPQIDKFAYETAQYCLKIHPHWNKE